jgi:hypothetical protein
MSQNTKHKFYKKYLGLLEEQDKLYDIKNSLGYEKLEKPYQYGYEAFNVLRDDISRRKDADIFQYLLDEYSSTTWSKDGIFYKVYKKYISDNRPKFKLISEADYLKLEPKYKKFFSHVEKEDKKFWNGTVNKYYRCYIEPHFLVMKIVNFYITHKKIIDNEVESDLHFVNDKIYELERVISPWYDGFITKHRRMQSKSQRRSDKVNVKKNLNANKYEWYIDEEYPLTHKKTNNWW